MDRTAAAEAFTPAVLEALGAFSVAPEALELVSLSENATFRVTDARDGAAYVLRLHRPGYHSLSELHSERVWTQALAAAGIDVPTAVRANDGRDYVPVVVAGLGQRRFAGMTRWIEGELLASVLARTQDPAQSGALFEKLGAIAASMHNQSSAWRPPVGFERHVLDTDGLMGETPFWGPFWEHPALSVAEKQLLLETRRRIRGALDRYGRRPSTWGVVHADLHPYNLLVDGDRLTVIDFDDAAFGWHQYDLAVALLEYENRPNFAAIECAFLQGYLAGRQMLDEDLALVPMFRLVRRMAVIGWLHQRPEIDRSSVFDALKDEVCAKCAKFEPPC
jgi:Ser/Thr protein kinase RdoA (MazF antagonist)